MFSDNYAKTAPRTGTLTLSDRLIPKGDEEREFGPPAIVFWAILEA